MRNVRTFTVKPALPEKLEPLRELAFNLRWTWDHETIDLFRRLDRDLWETCFHNPVLMLGKISQERLRSSAGDDGFIAHMERVHQSLLDYLKAETWYQKTYGRPDTPRVAYFSAEYGITESLPIYSGGLGILSGDHLKSASDLGLPVVGMGLLYQEGYFQQYLNADGWQQESYPINDFYNLPLTLVRGEDGAPLTVTVDLPGRAVVVQIWRLQVGRVPLFLLDSNIDANSREDQDITDALYGGGPDMRIKQEIIIGIGGIRALDAMGLQPDVCHMNEGHSAFLALERIRMLMSRQGFGFEQAREAAAAGNVFTTHTPVPAGIDIFAPNLIDEHFRQYYPALGLSRDQFLALGRENQNDPNAGFNMAVLAIRLSTLVNGVSQLHGKVARRMWQSMWPELPVDEVPIDVVTNGVHVRSWISHDMAGLYDRYLGPRWLAEPANEAVWQRVDEIPDEELWRTHERRRERLVAFSRRRLARQLQRRGAPPGEVQRASEVLHPDTLTIGFARRFATYKRATLLFHDVDRLARLVGDPERPVQILFAGKAHPHDQAGKAFIKEIVHHARREEFRNYIVFVEDYDMNVARYLVQGVDVWMNTPRRPREASGTSGMKSTVNGVLNMSIIDGWWAEAYEPDVGWAIGSGEDYDDPGYQDDVESAALYSLLEKEVVPLFYTRGHDGLPRAWIAKMKGAMRHLSPFFNTNRMVREYAESFYLPAAERYWHLMDQQGARANALAQWMRHVYQNWPQIRVEHVEADGDAIQVGDVLSIRARIHLGALVPEDVTVQIYWGQLDEDGQIPTGSATVMHPDDAQVDPYTFSGTVQSFDSGRFGYAIRVLAYHKDLPYPYQPGLILWA